MPDEIRIDFELMNDMRSTLLQSLAEIEQSSEIVEQLASKLDDGVLQGTTGDTLTKALRNRLIPKMKEITSKISEAEQNIQTATESIKDNDSDWMA